MTVEEEFNKLQWNRDEYSSLEKFTITFEHRPQSRGGGSRCFKWGSITPFVSQKQLILYEKILSYTLILLYVFINESH
jgi:hypothetical protein